MEPGLPWCGSLRLTRGPEWLLGGWSSERVGLIGQSLEFDIVRLDEERLQVDLSHHSVIERHRNEAFSSLYEGLRVEGRVTGVKPYGVFVEFGLVNALLHISEISDPPPANPAELFEVGQQIVARVLTVDVVQRRISLTLKQVSAFPREPPAK